VNSADVDLLVNAIINGGNDVAFDLNGDSFVNTADLTKWLADAATENGFAGPYLPGDANVDGTVDAADLNLVGINWQANVTASS
jgi:hypothetical protein